VACGLRFFREANPALVGWANVPALEAHSARCEALPEFAKVSQPLRLERER
jgi:hypothetical protein